jgi:hypothetical protein
MVRVTTRVMAAVVGAFLWMLGVNAALALLSWQSDGAVIAGFFALVLLGSVAVFAVARGGMRLVSMLPLMMLAVLATGCGTTIQPGHAGIIVDSYGKNRGVQDYTVTHGPRLVQPVDDGSVLRMADVSCSRSCGRTTRQRGARRSTRRSRSRTATRCRSRQTSRSPITLTSRNLPAFYVKFRTSDMATFTHGYLHSLDPRQVQRDRRALHHRADHGRQRAVPEGSPRCAPEGFEPYGVVLESSSDSSVRRARPVRLLMRSISRPSRSVSRSRRKRTASGAGRRGKDRREGRRRCTRDSGVGRSAIRSEPETRQQPHGKSDRVEAARKMERRTAAGQ